MLHIKFNGITKCSNIVGNILPTDSPHAHDKSQLFQNMVMLHIKLKRTIENAATWYQIFVRRPHYHPPPPWGWGQKVNIQLFQNMVLKPIKLKGNTQCSSIVANIVPADPYLPLSLGLGSKIKIQLFQNNVMLHIK